MTGAQTGMAVDITAVARAILARGRAGDAITLAVVGPSGVGKDSVMMQVTRERPALRLVRRVITRATDDSREVHDRMDQNAFAAAETEGRFALTWRAHGLCYGIPVDQDEDGGGGIALVNLSRTVLEAADRAFPRLGVVALSASTACLAQRLALRDGRDPDAIAARLSRDVPVRFDPARLLQVDNSGSLEHAVGRVVALCDALHTHAGAA